MEKSSLGYFIGQLFGYMSFLGLLFWGISKPIKALKEESTNKRCVYGLLSVVAGILFSSIGYFLVTTLKVKIRLIYIILLVIVFIMIITGLFFSTLRIFDTI